MRKHPLDCLNDAEFDSLLQAGMSELPPDDVARGVTPWRKAVNRILTGFALCAVTLNFWGLNYLLPAIGMLLTLLGFRALRRENPWLRTCWILTVVRCVYYFAYLILNATIYRNAFSPSAVGSVVDAGSIALQFVLYFSLWKGLRAVQIKAGLEPHAGGAAALILWSAAICLLALVQLEGLILGGILLVCYICIIRSLVKLSRELDEAGYCVAAAPVCLSDRSVAIGLALAIVMGCGCCYLFFHQYPMEWQRQQPSENTELQPIKAQLLDLGFPAHILEDLTEEDILACKDAVRVVVEVNDHPVNMGREVREVIGNTVSISTVYDQKELRLTGVGVELPGERERWKLFHHFQWRINPGFYGTDVIHLWTAYNNGQGWTSYSDMSGQILYDVEDRIYAAPYYSLGKETYTVNNIFWGEQISTDVFAAFSMPREGENHRGYVSYTIAEVQDGWIVDAWINYTHQASWLQYPAITAKEKHFLYGASDTRTFITVQDALQFNPNAKQPEL